MSALIRSCFRRARRADGFTLLELLVVLVILALLAALAVPQVLKYVGRAKTDTARIEKLNSPKIKNVAGNPGIA